MKQNTSIPTKLNKAIKLFALFTCFFSCSNLLNGQINGVITDALSGDPLIGVNVTVLGADNIGTISDIDGSFSIQANAGDQLSFTYVGYQEQTITLENNTPLTVIMSESSELLSEVVVVGYGSVGKKDLTGVVSKIKARDFNKGSISSPENLLNGKVAGLQISNNGEPGGENRIRLRGGTSLDASSDPLIVIDGVPMDTRYNASGRNPLNFVNAQDIESMTVLKDASAAAIYGSRGANGVIIITTKTGANGKLRVNYNGNVNVSQFNGRSDMLSPSNFRAAISAKAPQELEFLGDEETDWVKEVTQNALSTEHNVNFSGGSESFNYYVSGGYLKSNGVLRTSSHENKSIGLNINTKLFDNLINLNIKSKTGFANDRFTPDVLGAALDFDPTRPVFDEESPYDGYFQWNDALAVNNPVATLNQTNERGQTTRSLNNATLKINLPFVKGLSYTTNASYDYTTGTKRNEKDPLLKEGDLFQKGGYLFNEELRNYTSLLENFGTYKREVGANSSFELVAGHTWQETDRENRWEEGNGLELVDGEYNYTTDIRQDSFLVTNRLISFFGRTNININNKYLLTGSLRRDGSSRFGDENKWGLFPAAAVAWRVLEEDFASPLNNTFTDLKLRLSWGVTGNEDIEDFLFTTFYSYGTNDASYQFGNEFIQTLRGTGVDPSIKWEETSSLNAGLDFGFWNNRFTGSVDVYRKLTSDLLFLVATSAFTNLSDRLVTNIGQMENKGVELSLNTVLKDNKTWNWNVGFNASYNKNTILKLDNSSEEDGINYETGGISGDVGQTIQILKVGESVGTFRTYKHILNDEGLPRTDTEDWNGDGLKTLLDIYEDIDGDGIINENDLVTGKKADPDLILGLTTGVRFKQFDLAATLRSHIGNYVYNNVASSKGYFERLTDRETNNVHESAFVVNFNTRQLKSDYYIENASFLKLDNFTLGYNFAPTNIVRNMRCFVTVSNILTLTNYSGLDPELPQFNGGIDNNIYPVSRNFLVGLNLNF